MFSVNPLLSLSSAGVLSLLPQACMDSEALICSKAESISQLLNTSSLTSVLTLSHRLLLHHALTPVSFFLCKQEKKHGFNSIALQQSKPYQPKPKPGSRHKLTHIRTHAQSPRQLPHFALAPVSLPLYKEERNRTPLPMMMDARQRER